LRENPAHRGGAHSGWRRHWLFVTFVYVFFASAIKHSTQEAICFQVRCPSSVNTQWRRQDLLRERAKMEIMSWGELQGRVQQLLDD